VLPPMPDSVLEQGKNVDRGMLVAVDTVRLCAAAARFIYEVGGLRLKSQSGQ